MRKQGTDVRPLLIAIALGALILAACSPPQPDPTPDPLVFGVPSVLTANPGQAAQFAAELERRLDRPVTVQTVDRAVDLMQSLEDGTFDFAHLPPSMTAQTIAALELPLVAIVSRGGGTTYRAQYNARCDLGLTGLGDLAGLRFGFVSNSSVSGHLVPYLELTDAGIDPEVDVTTSFAGSHDAVILGIYANDLDAGVSWEDARVAVSGDHPDVNDVVCVIGYSTPIPNDAVLARAGLDADVRTAMQEALVAMTADDAGRAVLNGFLGSDVGYGTGPASLYDVMIRVMEEFY